jgi:hypothetical protein
MFLSRHMIDSLTGVLTDVALDSAADKDRPGICHRDNVADNTQSDNRRANLTPRFQAEALDFGVPKKVEMSSKLFKHFNQRYFAFDAFLKDLGKNTPRRAIACVIFIRSLRTKLPLPRCFVWSTATSAISRRCRAYPTQKIVRRHNEAVPVVMTHCSGANK